MLDTLSLEQLYNHPLVLATRNPSGFAGQIQVLPNVFITPIPPGSYNEFLWYFGFTMFVCLAVGVVVALIFANIWFLYPLFWLLAAIIISIEVLDFYTTWFEPLLFMWRDLLFWGCTFLIRFFRRWILQYA